MHQAKGSTKRFVGFFAFNRPGIVEAWRPREEDREICGSAEAARRYEALVRAMLGGELVDGLRPASVFERDEVTGEILRSTTADGFETTADSVRGSEGLRTLAALVGCSGRREIVSALRRMEGRRALS